MPEAARERWAVFALIIAIRIAVTVQVQSVGALGPVLLADPGLGLDYAGLGALIGAYMLPGIFVALPSGWLAARLGERRMVLAGLVLSVLGGLGFAMAAGFGAALAARLASGAGAALLNVVLSAMVMARFAGPALAPVMGGFLAAYPFGIGLTLMTLPALAAALSWRAAMLAAAAGCALVLAATPLVLRVARRSAAPAAAPPGRPLRGALLQSGEWGAVLAAGAAWAGLNVGYAVLLGFAPALLAERGASPGVAGALASLAGWASIPLAPLGGALAARTGRPLLATGVCVAASALSVLALALGLGPASAALLAAGLSGSIAGTVIMTLPAQALAPESRAFGMGVYWTIFYAGMTILPPIMGRVADAAGSAAAAITLAAVFHGATVFAVAAYGALLRQRLASVAPSTHRDASEIRPDVRSGR